MLSHALSIELSSSLAEQVCRRLGDFALYSARPDESVEAQAFASRVIGAGIADAETLNQVHARSGAGLFLTREQGQVTGALAMALLSRQGVAAILADRFDAVRIDLDHVAAAGEPPSGVYAWGVAASTRNGARRVVAGGRAISQGVLAHLPCFARVATDAGDRLLTQKLTFRPLPGSRTGLLVLQRPSVLGAAA